MFLSRVYIRLGKSYFDRLDGTNITLHDLSKLFEKVAKEKGFYSKNPNKSSTYYMSKTKHYIVAEANKIINRLPADLTTISMAKASKKQINRLFKTIKNKQGAITGHSLILLYVIFSTIPKDTEQDFAETRKNLINFANYIYQLVEMYLNYMIHISTPDPIAQFLISCYEKLLCELNQEANAKNCTFPPIPTFDWNAIP